METSTKRVAPLVLGLCSVLFLFYYAAYSSWHFSSSVKPAPGAHSSANSTLGFGAILAVSHAKSPRRNDLLYAANLTGIDIEIPDQPTWTDEDLNNFRTPGQTHISKGSALAWLGHLNALTWFLSTDLQTALILEDDVDWSIHLPTQIPPAARSIRTLLNTSSSSPSYWGSPSKWEILYLGHCGDTIPLDKYPTLPKIIYNDTSVPALSDLDGETQKLFQTIGVPEHSRIAHRSASPLCTFAYAVTRASAQRILESFGTEGEGGCFAFDVRILEACRDHHWLCYTISPELFHHIDSDSLITLVNEGKGKDEEKNAKDDVDEWRKERFRQTANIGCRARQKGFWVDVRERLAGFEWLKGRVGRGDCLMDAMEEDLSRVPEEL